MCTCGKCRKKRYCYSATVHRADFIVVAVLCCPFFKFWSLFLVFSHVLYAHDQVEWKGLSGPIEFKEGRRIEFKLDLVKLKQQSLVKVGEWSPQIGLNITDRSLFFDTGRINVTLLVITILVSKLINQSKFIIVF